MAKAYLVVEHIVTDAEKFEEYRTKAGPMIAKHGGRSLTKGGSHKFPEGGHWKPERVVVIEFPDMDALNAWYTSPEYQPLTDTTALSMARAQGASCPYCNATSSNRSSSC